GHHARAVDVFDAQQPLAVVGPGVQETRHGGDQRAIVQRAAGAGREAPPVAGWPVFGLEHSYRLRCQCDKRVWSSARSSSNTRWSTSASWLQSTIRAMILILAREMGDSPVAWARSMRISRSAAGSTPEFS